MRRTLTALFAASVLLVAACGDDDAGGTGPDTSDGSSDPAAPATRTDDTATVDTQRDADDGRSGDGMLSAGPQDINPQDRDGLQQGGELRLAITSLPENWNGHHPLGNEAPHALVRSPMEFRPFIFTTEGEPVPDENFVLDVEVDQGPPMVVTYTLNPEATWNNGDPIDVDDFRALWQARNGTNEQFRVVSTDGYEQIRSVEAGADNFEVVVTFETPYADWESMWLGMTHAESVANPQVFNQGWSEINPEWFTGPFIVDDVDQAQQVVELVPNPNWWGDEPLLDKISFRVVSADADVQAFANGELDAAEVGPDPNAYQIATGADDTDIRTAGGPDWRHITLNHEAGLMQDKIVRQAFMMSLDRKTIGESDLAGIPWPVEPLNNRVFMPGQEGYQDNAEGFHYDPDAARELLESDGWELGDDGVYEKAGQRLTVELTQIVGVPVSANEMRLVQAQLQETGFDVQIVDVTQQDLGNKLLAGEFQAIAFSWFGDSLPLDDFNQIYGTGSDSNYARSNLPKVDSKLDDIATELDRDKRIEMANEIDRLLWEAVHTIPLYQRPQIWAVRDQLANYGAFGVSRVDTAAQWEDIGWMS